MPVLPDYGGLDAYRAAVARCDPFWTDDQVFAMTGADRSAVAPETGWAYSSVGYLVVRRALEAASGRDLAAVLDELVLAPLGLSASRLANVPEDMRKTPFAEGLGYHPGWVFSGVVVGPVAEAALALHWILAGYLFAPETLAAMLARHPIGDAIPGRPWTATGYGLGLMIGDMRNEAMAEPLRVAGHSAGGPGSVGAVYRDLDSPRGRIVAAFAAGSNEGVVEAEVLRRLVAD